MAHDIEVVLHAANNFAAVDFVSVSEELADLCEGRSRFQRDRRALQDGEDKWARHGGQPRAV